MKEAFVVKRNIKSKIKYILGGTKLSHEYYLFLTVHTLFLVFTRIPAIFINTLLMDQTRSINTTLFYNGAIFAAGAVTMLVSAQVMHKKGCRFTATAGITIYTILYLCYVLFQEQVGKYYMLFGLLNGIADGFYYISYGSMVLGYTTIQNRDSGMGIISTLGAFVNLIIPFLSGSIITIIGGSKGYITIFVIAFAIALLAMRLVFRLPKDEVNIGKGVEYKRFLKFLRKNKQIYYGLLAETVKGIREGTFMFILNLLLYQLVKNEFLIGCNSFLTGFLSICSFWFMSHFFRPQNRRKYMFLSVCGLSIVTIFCFQIVNPFTIVIFSATNAFLAGMIEVPCYTTFFDVSQSAKGIEEFSPELLAFHEVFVVSGRCLGLLLFAFVNILTKATLKAQIFSLLLLTVIQFITILLCKKASAEINK